jgi:hypothetical protein
VKKGGEMNAFEDIVGRYLGEEGYWVRHSVKLDISKEDKVALKKHSMPRPEIDIVALNVRKNELLLLEVKSFLDSPYGVNYYEIIGEDKDAEKYDRYKLLTNDKFRNIITSQLKKEYIDKGLILGNIHIKYGLAAGHIHSGHEDPLSKYFSKRGWILITPAQIKETLRKFAGKGYEDDLVTVTAKLIMRK